jgi:hypothetical protein
MTGRGVRVRLLAAFVALAAGIAAGIAAVIIAIDLVRGALG